MFSKCAPSAEIVVPVERAESYVFEPSAEIVSIARNAGKMRKWCYWTLLQEIFLFLEEILRKWCYRTDPNTRRR